MTSTATKRWYVVHTYSGFEEKAKQGLLDRIKSQNMQEKFGQVFVPRTVSEQILKSGKKKKVEKTSFPGYILVEMVFGDDTSLLVRETPKITGFVGNVRSPKPMTDQEVLRLTSPEAAAKEKESMPVEIRFKKGESVKIKEGPFTNFDGIVDEVKADRMKLRVLVSIFGRETPVELDFNQVDKSGT